MIALDTNVLVRYIVQDDPQQSAMATALIDALTPAEPALVPLVVVVELVWVLESCYGNGKEAVITVLETLLHTRELQVEQADVIWKAFRLFSTQSADFADCLVAAGVQASGCQHAVTFDRKAARLPGMLLLA